MLPLPLLSFKQQVRARRGDDYSGQSLGDYSEQGLEALEKLRSHVRAYLWRRDIQKKRIRCEISLVSLCDLRFTLDFKLF